MAMTEKNRKIMEKKYQSLQKKTLAIEKKLYPQKYSYRAFVHEKEPYLQFGNDMVYPIELVKNIISSIKKDTLKVGNQTVGLVLELPKDFKNVLKGKTTVAKSKKTKKKATTPLKTSKRATRKQTSRKKAVKKVQKRKRNGKPKTNR